MSKEILDHSAEESQVSMSLVGRVVIIAGILLAAIHFGTGYGLELLGLPPGLERQFSLAFFLFFTWLAVNSGIRTVNKLLPGIAVGWLLITGMGIGLWAQAVLSLAKWAMPWSGEQETLPLLSVLLTSLLPSLAVSLLVAVLTTITLRVKSRLLAIVLRVVIFGLLALLIYLWI